jgi:tetratricopeptide (TPR) repeat protein
VHFSFPFFFVGVLYFIPKRYLMIKLIEIPPKLENYKTTIVVFILISICVLLFQNNRFGFNKGHHGFVSSHGASISKNISAKNNFLLFESVFINNHEEVSHQVYSRFPIVSFLIIKIFMNIFSPNLSMEIIIARQVMNLFFIGSIIIAYLSIYELLRSHLSSISIVLFSFSSFYLHYYNDMIWNETPTLFGFILGFHGIVLYHLYGRKCQLYLKVIAGLSLGWQIYSMLFAYILCSLIRDFVKQKSITRLIQSDQIKLGLLSLLFGLFFLGFNFVNEMVVTGKNFSEIGSFKSAKSRIGKDNEFQEKYGEYLAWGSFSKGQLHRIGAMSIPYVLKKNGNFKLYGGIVLIITFLGCIFSKKKILLLTLLLSGLFWAFPMRSFTFTHDYQSLYYIGIPIVLFFLIIHTIEKKLPLALPFLLFFSIVTFLSTNIILNQSKAKEAQKCNLITYDFQDIINYTETGNIFFIDGLLNEIAYGYHAVEFYLSGNYLTTDKNFAEYIISKEKNYNSYLLTPKNSNIFLFRGTPHYARAFNKRGIEYYKAGSYSQAIQDFSKAIEKDDQFVDSFVNRGIAWKKIGDYKRAIEDYDNALEKAPDTIKAINSLAWLLATCPDPEFRDGKRALILAKRGKELNPGSYNLDTLAVAYAENGDFQKAIETQKEVIRLLEENDDERLIQECKKHLNSYQKREAWREK